MRYRTPLLVAVVALVALSGCADVIESDSPTETPVDTTVPDATGETPTSDSPTETPDVPSETPPATEEESVPPDPEEDRLGWEDGYWHNESIAVDPADGLNESELDAVVSRAMARVEHVRGLEFEERVPVEVITREEFLEENRAYSVSPAQRLHENVKWEATLMVDESTDAVSVQESNRGASVLGYYDYAEGRLVVVSEDPETPELDELTLAHELQHALQDQHWTLSHYAGETVEENNAYSGLVEGDANYVEHLYEQRCGAEWDCLPSRSAAGGADIHFGLYFVNFQPYSDGPAFVREHHEADGWTAVNDLYEDPPESTEQIIHPEKYPEGEPTNVTVEDASADGWEVLDVGEGSIDYATFGEAGLASMVYYPTFESARGGGSTWVTVPYGAFFNDEAVDPYDYAFEETDGWDGDRLYPYVNETSAETNETGYVWKIAWDSDEDAEEFVGAYETILEYRNAEPVEDRPGTWRIPEGERFADAFWVHQDGDEVVVANAPDVETLGEIHADAGGTD